MNFGTIFILCYLAYVLIMGIWFWRKIPMSSAEEYALGGRSFGWFLAIFSMMAAQYSALTIMGFPAMAYRGGLANWLAVMVMPIFSYALWWAILSGKLWKLGKKHGFMTAGDVVAHYYGGKGVRYITGAILFLSVLPYVQTQIMGTGFLVEKATAGAISFTAGVIGIYVAIMVYILLGGMRGAVYAEAVNGVILTAGMLGAAIYVATKVGLNSSFEQVMLTAPEKLLVPFGPWNWTLIMTFGIVAGLGFPTQPHMFLRMFMPKDLRWNRVFPPILVLSFSAISVAGFYLAMTGIVDFPSLSKGESDQIVLMAVNNYGGQILLAVVAAAALAAMISSLDGQAHGLGVVATRDFVSKLTKKEVPQQTQVMIMRLVIAGSLLVGLILAFTFPQYLSTLGVLSAGLAAQAVPIILAAFLGLRWVSREGAMAAILGGSIATVVFSFGALNMYKGIHGGFWGLMINVALLIIVSMVTSHKPDSKAIEDFTEIGW